VELADTSAWTSRSKSVLVEAEFGQALADREVAICGPVAMELLWTARSLHEFREIRDELSGLDEVPLAAEAWRRAADVWELLVQRGRHRQVPWADLLVAAAAELASVTVCHYDHHFEVIAEVTGQPVRAIAPLGSL
jgi:predicted nucleic acid-binding protein